MEKPLLLVILISWEIALVEYCFAVPANRVGYAGGWSAGQLKIAQEGIALLVFGGFMVWVLGEPLHWRHAAAFLCIMAAVGLSVHGALKVHDKATCRWRSIPSSRDLWW